ncbi:MAG: HIG1 domain-containing protein [Sphingopyxis sp.]|nr:HIG1 domain-containing protein [Sphingopyxis sp.]
MNALLIIGVVVAAALVLVALGRGLFHFTQSHQAEMNGTLKENQLMQNRMMMARVKWQAITILLLILIGIFAAAA